MKLLLVVVRGSKTSLPYSSYYQRLVAGSWNDYDLVYRVSHFPFPWVLVKENCNVERTKFLQKPWNAL